MPHNPNELGRDSARKASGRGKSLQWDASNNNLHRNNLQTNFTAPAARVAHKNAPA
jgi:hypothetical protein